MSSLQARLDAVRPGGLDWLLHPIATRYEQEAFDMASAGAENLEDEVPGSIAALDLDILDVGDSDKCPVGQTYGNFANAPEHLRENAFQYGYAINIEHRREISYPCLTRAWKKVAAVYAEEAA